MALRVLHAPALAAGNAARIAQAERELGLASWCVTWDGNPLGYPVDEVIRSVDQGRIAFELQRWKLLWRALREFDVIHFNYGQTFMPMRSDTSSTEAHSYSSAMQQAYRWYSCFLELRDLPILKRMGKSVFVTFQGDDARQGDYCRQNFEITFANRVEPGYYSSQSDKAKRRRIESISRYVDGIYALNPDLLHVLPARAQFLPYATVDLTKWKPIRDRVLSQIPVIVHAPTHRLVKGTDIVLEVISRLRSEGCQLEFVLVEGLSHSQVRSLFERADLCIDQLFAGWYGGLAVEMMALGKPVISYLRESDLKFIPEEMRKDLPVINAHPNELYYTLKRWLALPRQECEEQGRKSRAFVEKWHDPRRIAAKLKVDYDTCFRKRS